MKKLPIVIIIVGLSLAWVFLAIGWFQINEMMMFFGGYDKLKNNPWIQEPFKLNALYSFELFWILTFLSLPIALATLLLAWLSARK